MGATSHGLLGLVPSRITWHQVALGPCVSPRDLLRGVVPLGLEVFIHLSAPIVSMGWPMGGWRARSQGSRRPAGPRTDGGGHLHGPQPFLARSCAQTATCSQPLPPSSFLVSGLCGLCLSCLMPPAVPQHGGTEGISRLPQIPRPSSQLP